MSVGLKANVDGTSGAVQVNGNDVVTVNSSGQVGVGTSSPSEKLEAAGNIVAAANTGSVALKPDGVNGNVIRWGGAGASAGILRLLGPGDTEHMRISGSGNVGIGTTSPGSAYRLHTAGSTPGIAIQNTSTGGGWIDFLNSAGTVRGNISYDIANGIMAFGTSASGAFAERMRIDSAGNVGIGTSSPDAKLEVLGAGTVARFTGDGYTYQGIGVRTLYGNATRYSATYFDVLNENNTTVANMLCDINADGSSAWVWSTTPAGSRTSDRRVERLRITNTGEVWIAGATDRGAYNLQCNGTGVWGAGAYVNGSDERIKDEISPIGSCLSIVNALNPVTFRYKPDFSKDQALQPGFIAQELQEALADQPYLEGVVQAGPEYLSVAYQTLIPVLTKALQEANAKIDALETRLAALEAK